MGTSCCKEQATFGAHRNVLVCPKQAYTGDTCSPMLHTAADDAEPPAGWWLGLGSNAIVLLAAFLAIAYRPSGFLRRRAEAKQRSKAAGEHHL